MRAIAHKRLLALLPLVTLLSGCLQIEEYETRILREQGEPAVIIFTLNNIYSDETDPVKIQKDFDDLIKSWRGKDDLQHDGILVKDRELTVRDGQISGRETGIVFNLDEFGIKASADGSLLQMELGDVQIVETNGHVVSGSKTIIEWPKDAHVLQVKVRDKLDPAFEKSQPVMLKLLNTYLASK